MFHFINSQANTVRKKFKFNTNLTNLFFGKLPIVKENLEKIEFINFDSLFCIALGMSCGQFCSV